MTVKAARAVAATGVVASIVCCILPLALPVVLAGAGAILAWIGGAFAWVAGAR
ncbi:MAG: hypothetical protein ACJ8DC_04490 [Gemmatimonadales bacterium]